MLGICSAINVGSTMPAECSQTGSGSGSGLNGDVMQDLKSVLSPAIYNALEQSLGQSQGGMGGMGGMGGIGSGCSGGVQGEGGGIGMGGASGMTLQSASGALAGYMGANGDQKLNVNDLYQLSIGNPASGNTQTPSPDVQQAAQYMLANPKQYEQLETHDVAGADGIAGINDFQAGAQGLI
jgi:hypothetical protein